MRDERFVIRDFEPAYLALRLILRGGRYAALRRISRFFGRPNKPRTHLGGAS